VEQKLKGLYWMRIIIQLIEKEFQQIEKMATRP
ncbi:uncharacterized protein METZ01_LOCUS63202, partial [marine metagenome]